LDLLARDRCATFQELADEAFSDLLKKHHRPTDLRSALKASAEPSRHVRQQPRDRRTLRGPRDL
jgi:hypothetical protein